MANDACWEGTNYVMMILLFYINQRGIVVCIGDLILCSDFVLTEP